MLAQHRTSGPKPPQAASPVKIALVVASLVVVAPTVLIAQAVPMTSGEAPRLTGQLIETTRVDNKEVGTILQIRFALL